MKRLFAVRNKIGTLDHDTANDGYHESKAAAKEHRNRMNSGLASPYYFVTLGPDHAGHNGSSHRKTRKRRLRGTR